MITALAWSLQKFTEQALHSTLHLPPALFELSAAHEIFNLTV